MLGHLQPRCNAPDTTFHICTPTLAIFGYVLWYSLRGWVCLSFCILFMSCISYHVIMCISFAYVFVACIRAFSPLPVLQSDTPTCTGAPLLHLFVCRFKRSQNGPRLAKWPWYTTGRTLVKFHAIWRSFDTPTVNRITAKASFRLQPNSPPK